MDAKLERFFNADKSLQASIAPNLFGKGLAVTLHVLGRTGEYHRTPVRYIIARRTTAISFAKKLVAYGVTI